MSTPRIVLALAFCLPALAASEERCPWLNVATAGGFLGGAVQATVTPTSCEFVRRHSGHESILRIEVTPVSGPHAQCKSGAEPLKAIGNEAQACTYEGKEQVVGRVRDQAFLVRIGDDDPSVTPKTLREKARNIAEQVAGILF